MTIKAYCLDWHVKNSAAFRDLLVEPLANHLDIRLVPWDGEKIEKNYPPHLPLIFCMLPPPLSLVNDNKRKVLWVPMWDQAQGYDDKWWGSLPKNVHIIAFSEIIYKKALRAKLSALHLRYFKSPGELQPAPWNGNRVVYYWNRVGMVGPDFLEQFCSRINADELLFKPDIDPRIDANKYYDLPARLGNTKVTVLQPTQDRNDFLDKIRRANIVISPRLAEGVGMVFLESLARGCAVVAHNAPTMNEYIVNKESGLLIEKSCTKKGLLKRHPSPTSYEEPYLITPFQDWKSISKINFEKLGKAALDNHIKGYAAWQHQLKLLYEFIMD